MVERSFLREATRRVPPDPFKGRRKLGLDEIAERKGRHSYDVMFYHLDIGKPVEVLQGRTRQQLIDYLKALPEEATLEIEERAISVPTTFTEESERKAVCAKKIFFLLDMRRRMLPIEFVS